MTLKNKFLLAFHFKTHYAFQAYSKFDKDIKMPRAQNDKLC